MTTMTTAEAAGVAGMSPAVFRATMSALRRREGRDFRRPGPDARTPAWDGELVREWAGTRARRAPKAAGHELRLLKVNVFGQQRWGCACGGGGGAAHDLATIRRHYRLHVKGQ